MAASRSEKLRHTISSDKQISVKGSKKTANSTKKQKKKRLNIYEEFLHCNKKGSVDQIDYMDLGVFDDLLSDCFIDKVSVWCLASFPFVFSTLVHKRCLRETSYCLDYFSFDHFH